MSEEREGCSRPSECRRESHQRKSNAAVMKDGYFDPTASWLESANLNNLVLGYRGRDVQKPPAVLGGSL